MKNLKLILLAISFVLSLLAIGEKTGGIHMSINNGVWFLLVTAAIAGCSVILNRKQPELKPVKAR